MELRTDPAESPFDDRYSSSSSTLWIWVAVLIALIGAGIAGYYYWQQEPAAPQVTATPAPPDDRPEPPGAQSAPLQPPPERGIRHPLAQAPAAESGEAPPLPSLEQSDPMMRDSIAGLIGRKSFDELVWPSEIIRRIVATVDNLPRKTAPQRVMPVQPVPGSLAIVPAGDEVILGPENFKRYSPYVRVFEMIDTRALVRRYVASYPLFQKAYQELGFPNAYFNDRLMETIDNLLAAPEVTGPIVLVRPKVLYEFADPELEELSAGQKALLRMGPENAARVKAKLREIRRELLAAAGR